MRRGPPPGPDSGRTPGRPAVIADARRASPWRTARPPCAAPRSRPAGARRRRARCSRRHRAPRCRSGRARRCASRPRAAARRRDRSWSPARPAGPVGTAYMRRAWLQATVPNAASRRRLARISSRSWTLLAVMRSSLGRSRCQVCPERHVTRWSRIAQGRDWMLQSACTKRERCMKWRTLGILAALAAAGVAAALWLGRAQPIVVDTVEVGRGPVAETVTNTRAGTVEACRRAKLAPPAGGQIARLLVKKGDRVQRIRCCSNSGTTTFAPSSRSPSATRPRPVHGARRPASPRGSRVANRPAREPGGAQAGVDRARRARRRRKPRRARRDAARPPSRSG